MTPLTREWARKAEADWVTARREMRARKSPNFDAACFHSQQCAEKYLKACLQELEEPFPKTHHLGQLLDLLLSHEPSWQPLRPDLVKLTTLAVSIRYPGAGADRKLAREALSTCETIRRLARARLGVRQRRARRQHAEE